MLLRIKQLLSIKTLLSALLAVNLVTASGTGFAQSTVVEEERPSMLSMYTDLLVLRPIGAASTVVGAVLYVVSLPFTLPVGNQSDVGNALVVEPAMFTFYRCLGCTRTGYSGKDNEGVVESSGATAE